MAELLDEIPLRNPGKIQQKPMGITARETRSRHRRLPSRISELVNGRRPITADTALRLGLYSGMDARFWRTCKRNTTYASRRAS